MFLHLFLQPLEFFFLERMVIIDSKKSTTTTEFISLLKLEVDWKVNLDYIV